MGDVAFAKSVLPPEAMVADIEGAEQVLLLSADPPTNGFVSVDLKNRRFAPGWSTHPWWEPGSWMDLPTSHAYKGRGWRELLLRNAWNALRKSANS